LISNHYSAIYSWIWCVWSISFSICLFSQESNACAASEFLFSRSALAWAPYVSNQALIIEPQEQFCCSVMIQLPSHSCKRNKRLTDEELSILDTLHFRVPTQGWPALEHRAST
jgi:hypothetical protein